jgi:hypothetical protein
MKDRWIDPRTRYRDQVRGNAEEHAGKDWRHGTRYRRNTCDRREKSGKHCVARQPFLVDTPDLECKDTWKSRFHF